MGCEGGYDGGGKEMMLDVVGVEMLRTKIKVMMMVEEVMMV